MDRPTSIKIGHLDYRIEWVNDTWCCDTGRVGEINYNKCVISICETLPPYKLADTFLHETIHGLFHNYNRLKLDSPIEIEDATEWIAAGLVMVWRDNPEVFKWWNELAGLELAVYMPPKSRPDPLCRDKHGNPIYAGESIVVNGLRIVPAYLEGFGSKLVCVGIIDSQRQAKVFELAELAIGT